MCCLRGSETCHPTKQTLPPLLPPLLPSFTPSLLSSLSAPSPDGGAVAGFWVQTGQQAEAQARMVMHWAAGAAGMWLQRAWGAWASASSL